ncbi:MAG: class I SAM-dependent methyltransferase [Nitrospirae bacterium]|nr:class I SAM-dependent methyltransferase [Nitrospirota bacterium]
MKEESFDPLFFRQLKEAEETYFWFQVRRKWIYDRISKVIPPPAKILEVGCGTGNVSSFLAHKGYDVTGCEYYEEALVLGWPGFTKVRGDASSLPFQDGSFDIVGLFDVIEHIEDDTAPLKEAFRVLRQGGIAVVTVPARDELWSFVDKRAFHKRRYTKERLAGALHNADFVLNSNEYIFMMLYLPMKILRMRPVDVRSPFEINPAVNRILKGWFDMERRVSQMISLPIGTSLLAIAEKNDIMLRRG